MMDKAKHNKKKPLHPVVPPLDLWVPESQDKEEVPKIRLIRFLLNGADMEDEGFHEVD